MHKFIKLVILTIGMTVSISNITYGNSIQTEDEYVISEIEGYLAGAGYSNDDCIKISQEYIVNNDNNDTGLYFVNVNDNVIGAMSISEINGENVSAFIFGGFEECNQLEDEFAIVSYDGGLAISSESEINVISGSSLVERVENICDYEYNSINYKDISQQIEIEEDKFDYVTNSYNSANVTVGSSLKTAAQISGISNKFLYYMNPVGFRQNYDINGGICWAAAGASIINYKLGTSYTTKNVYNAMVNVYGAANTIGTTQVMSTMFNSYGVYMNFVGHKLSFDTVLQRLGSNNPILCNFFYSPNGTTTSYGHSVVLCGCYFRSDLEKYYYVYMDPNYASDNVYVVNHVPKTVLDTSTGYTFYYNDVGTIYNNWLSAFY